VSLTAFRAADAASVDLAFGRLIRNLRDSRWLGKTNPYRKDVTGTLTAQLDLGRPVQTAPMREYLAAASFLHCLDGWSYLGRAISAAARGDQGASIHLGYYASLRATLAIAGVRGIGILRNSHFATNAAGQLHRFNGSTHQKAWEALQYLASDPSTQAAIGSALRPGGVALSGWITEIAAAGASAPISASWLSAWGLDVRRYAEDQDLRNEASYRPSALANRPRQDPVQLSRFLREMWALAQPLPNSRFDQLDWHLLKLAVDQLPISRRSSVLAAHDLRVRSGVEKILGAGANADRWVTHLTDRTDYTPPALLIFARARTRVGSASEHYEVVARAFLLLRLASGLCAELLARTHLTKADLGFWSEEIGLGRGLWQLAGEYENADLIDLWIDVASALGELEAWELKAGVMSQERFVAELAPELHVVTTCERVGLWALGL